eukprot:626674-Pelagomonas_calceolata.AAC.1
MEIAENALERLFSAEIDVSQALGVSVPQLRFALALFGSVPVGGGFRLIRNATEQAWAMGRETCCSS